MHFQCPLNINDDVFRKEACRWGGGRHTPGRKIGGTTEELSSIPVSQKNSSPIKISSHGFHIALYSSWLWWRGPEPSLLLRIAYSKQNGECPTLKQCQETTKQNKQHIMFFWSGQWLQDLGEKTQPFGLFLVRWIARLKNQRRKNEVVICFYLALQLGQLSGKV